MFFCIIARSCKITSYLRCLLAVLKLEHTWTEILWSHHVPWLFTGRGRNKNFEKEIIVFIKHILKHHSLSKTCQWIEMISQRISLQATASLGLTILTDFRPFRPIMGSNSPPRPTTLSPSQEFEAARLHSIWTNGPNDEALGSTFVNGQMPFE